MKPFIYLILLLISFGCFSQKKLMTRDGILSFEASVPTFEEIKATNDNISLVLNTSSNEIASLVLIKGFRYKIPLMERHFNKYYMESDDYPKASFKGTIQNFDVSKLTSVAKEYSIEGTFKIHGKSKKITILARIKSTPKGIEIVSNFVLNTEDYNINISSIVSKKVSKEVLVNLNAILHY